MKMLLINFNKICGDISFEHFAYSIFDHTNIEYIRSYVYIDCQG